MKHPLWDALPRWLLTWLVCLALTLGLGALLRIDCRWWLAALVLLAWCAALAAAEYFGRFWAMLALWIAALGLCLLMADRSALAEAARAAFARTGEANGQGELALLLLCATAALLLSALLRLYWLRAALSLGWIGLWIAAALLGWPIPRLLPAAMIPLLLLTLSETIRRLRHEPAPDRALQRSLLLWLLPAALLLGALPTSAEPYGYPLLHAVAETVEQLWNDMETALLYRQKGDREFGLSFNGASDEARVGEGVEEESASILYAKPGKTPYGALYLFGNAWDHFDGQGWSSTLIPGDAEKLNWSLDTAERVYALWRLGASAEFPSYFRTNSVYLNYRNMNVRTMFTVANATRITTDARRFPYADAPTGSLFDYVQQDDTWYRVYFLEARAGTRDALIAAAEGAAYDAEARGPRWSEVARDFQSDFYLDMRNDVELEKTLAERSELIRGVYLDCTGVSDRAVALAEAITANCGGDYEKTAAIAAYLQGNYHYTLHPDPVPKGEDFLDWLLFEGREGYCTWYATAATLLARSVGVPARYVQGYRAELVGEEFAALGPGNAHAWCECYIAGYGWVTVEATPGFRGEGDGTPGAAAERTPETAPAAEKEAHNGGAGAGGAVLPMPPLPAGQGGKPAEPASEPSIEAAPFRWLPILIAAVLLAALAAAWLWLRARRRRRYAQADGAARLLLDLEVLLRDLRGKGYPRRPEESLRQYFARLPWRYLLVSEAEAEEMAALYDRTFFSQAAPSEAELEKHRAFAARFRPRTARQWLIWHRLQGKN